MSTTSGILQTALWNVQQTAQRLELDDDMTQRIIEPSEQIRAVVHPVLPDGQASARRRSSWCGTTTFSGRPRAASA